MEVETYLGSPVQLARAANVKVPRIETLYALLRHDNITNKDKPPQQPQSPAVMQPPPRVASAQPTLRQAPMVNGGPRPPRGPSSMSYSMGPPGRRGPPPVNGFPGPPHSMQRRPSFDENALDEFSHVVLYDDVPDGDVAAAYGENGGVAAANLRERELMLREKELQLKQQEMAMRSRGGRRPSHIRHQDFDDDDDEDDYVDPMQFRGPPHPPVDADNIDMMSVTSRRTKRPTSQGQLRRDMYSGGNATRPGSFQRPYMGRNRASTQLMSDMPTLGENILDNPMMSFSSNRYGNVDRKEMHDESRANSLTATRLQEIGHNGGP